MAIQYGILKTLASKIMELEPVKDFVDGIVSLSKALGFIVFLPLKIMGLHPTGFLVQMVYLGIMVYLLYKLLGSWKFSIALSIALIIFSSL